MCHEITRVHHDIDCAKGSQVGALLEDMTKDILPNGLSNLSSGLIGKGSMSAKPPNRAEGSPTTKVGKVSKHSLPGPSPGSGLPLILSQNCVWVSPMAGGVMGVSTGNRPTVSGGHLINFHWQESDGLRLTL